MSTTKNRNKSNNTKNNSSVSGTGKNTAMLGLPTKASSSLENSKNQIYSCYTLNKKIIDYVKKEKVIDECIKTLKGEKKDSNDENKDSIELPLEISNFPKLIENNPDYFKTKKTIISETTKNQQKTKTKTKTFKIIK